MFITHPVTVHITVYVVLSVLVFVEMRFRKASMLGVGLTALAIAIIYGGTDELHQAFVPGRSSSAADVGYDALGALAGVLAAWAVMAWRPKSRDSTLKDRRPVL